MRFYGTATSPAMVSTPAALSRSEINGPKATDGGHVTSGSPIAINQYVLFSTMIGMTYVVDVEQAIFDETALVSINDLGSAGETWSLSAPS
jgi:hypothetical protein